MIKNVLIKVKEQKIKGTLFYPRPLKTKNPAILFIHGWTSNEKGYAPRAEALSKLGFICLTFNLRGHDGKQKTLDKFSRADHLEDCIAAYDFLLSQNGVDKTQIGIIGASYGAYFGSILSLKRKLKWIVLRAPALYHNEKFDSSTSKLINDREDEFFQRMKPEKNNLALEGIKKFKGDLFIIESDKDKIIPNRIIKYFKNAIIDKTKISHRVIKNAKHELTEGKQKQEFIDILVRWFEQHT